MPNQPYRDPQTTKIEDWQWRPLEGVQAKLGLRGVPDYIQKGFGGFMTEQAGRAQKGGMTPRDLIKAYTIAQSSIGRGGLSHATATKTGMRIPRTSGEVRPEGAFAEWLGSREGQQYLDAAERGKVHTAAIDDLRGKFAPFGKQNDQADKMVLAVKLAQAMAPKLNQALTGTTDDYRDYAEQMKGIAGAKSGFIGSLLGRGDLPTLDARQLNLHALPAPVGVGAMMARGKGKGAREAVDRLSGRQRAMGLSIDPSLLPYYQHLAHHAVWDKASGTETTHDDLMRAMRGYAQGGDVEPTPDQMRRALAQRGYLESTPTKRNAAVGQRYGASAPTGLAPKTPVDLEKRKGASMLVMPWDSTSRNVEIHSISGHDLPESVTTHGGQDYARDLEHIRQGIGGASNRDIAKRIAERERMAQIENERGGGTGEIIHLPITMGERGEDFSMTPTEILHQLVIRAMVPPEELEKMNAQIRAHKIIKNKKYVQPFGNFVGLEHPEFSQQIVTGKGLDTTAGELRKAIVDRLGYLKGNQKALDFNMEDVVGAVTDPALRGVPKGYIGNTVIGNKPAGMQLRPSVNKAYDTDFSAKYLGTLGHSMPAETLFGERMGALAKEFEGKVGDMRTNVLGALEKRKEGVSQMLNNEVLDNYGKYLLARDKKLRTGSYAEGGKVKEEPSQDEMLARVMLRKDSVSLKDIGANEAPNMKTKAYTSPDMGKGMPVGGVDFQPENPGQQMLPGQPGQPPGQPPQAGGPPGAPGQPPAPAGGPPPGAPPGPPGAPPPGGPLNAPSPLLRGPQRPQSNILSMTPQGQAMAAMRPNPVPMRPGMPMPKMADGGSVEDMRRALGKFLEGSHTQQRLYHGTMATEGGKGTEAIRRIKPSKEGALGSGVYLTPQSEFASTYAGFPARSQLERDIETGSDFAKKSARQLIDRMDRGAVEPHEVGGNMLPVYAQIKNPLVIRSKRGQDPMIMALVQLGMTPDKAANMVEKAYEQKGYIGKQVQQRAQAAGHDALMQYRDGDLTEVVHYNPRMIKSATGNRGTYDTSKDDLSMARGGTVGSHIKLTERKL